MKDSKYNKEYPAVSGTEYASGKRVKLGIRSDVQEILNFDDNRFAEWYHNKKFAVGKLLTKYEIVASIPDLRYGYEDQKLGLDAYSGLSGMIETLKRGLEYLEAIKNIKEDCKNYDLISRSQFKN